MKMPIATTYCFKTTALTYGSKHGIRQLHIKPSNTASVRLFNSTVGLRHDLKSSNTSKMGSTSPRPPSVDIRFSNDPPTVHSHPVGLFVNNCFSIASSGECITTLDPITDREVANVPLASSEDVDRAVRAAKSAFDNIWKDMSGTERGRYLAKLADLLEENKQYISQVEALDTGKPVDVVLTEELPECVNVCRYYSGWADKIYGQSIQPFKEKIAFTAREPLGVCALIVPWNYPLMLSIWKMAPALAAGNTIVLKSSELTPLSASYLGYLAAEANFPPGVINILSGDSTTGKSLSSHPGINKISFTGSLETGKQIMKAAAQNMVPVTLELGGKSAALVFSDADIDQAVKWCHAGIMSNAGQICTATSRIYVSHEIYELFLRSLADYTAEKSKESQFQQPQISKKQQQKIQRYIQSGLSEGARLIYSEDTGSETGYFVGATILADVGDDMTVSTEEIFGPVAVCDSFNSMEEAVMRANSSCYGLASAIFTADITRALQVARNLQAGTVWINSSNDSDFRVPFGGYKKSGFGRELGEHALQAYTQEKSVHINIGSRL
ncbi:putative aldehyde dehydrogenase Ald3 [Myxozyma melibiosi]|uniref:Aldehyde dehydrogenase Ald3 n=1 Tax=Myxozyma melibiosi TaxID=54550 RepID=A0ABR1F8J7_9ASCO